MHLPPSLTGIRAIARLSATVALMIIGSVVTIIHNVRPNFERELKFKKSWSKLVLRSLGITLHSVGDAPKNLASRSGELIAANHITFIDIFVINSVCPSTFVSKSDVTSWPIVGQMARRAGTIFLDRGSRRAAHRTQEQIVECLMAGQNIAVFPEGTTSAGHSVMPFHGALFQAAVDAGTSVRCASICYLDSAGNPTSCPAYIGDLTLATCLWNIATASGLTARIEWAEPITAPHQDRRHLSKHAHRVVAHQLSNIIHS